MKSRLMVVLLAIGAAAMLVPAGAVVAKKRTPVAYVYSKSKVTAVLDGKHKNVQYITGDFPPKACKKGSSFQINTTDGNKKISKSGKASWSHRLHSDSIDGVVYSTMKVTATFRKKKGKRNNVRVTWKTSKTSSGCKGLRKGAMTLKYKGPAYGG